MKLTYVILVADEPEFHKLYENLRINKREEDNIFVLADLNKLDTNQSLKDEIYKLFNEGYNLNHISKILNINYGSLYNHKIEIINNKKT